MRDSNQAAARQRNQLFHLFPFFFDPFIPCFAVSRVDTPFATHPITLINAASVVPDHNLRCFWSPTVGPTPALFFEKGCDMTDDTESAEINALIEAYRQGDPEARDALFTKITPTLRVMVRRRFGGFQRETPALQTTLIVDDMLLTIDKKKHLPWHDWNALQRFIGKVLEDYKKDKRRRKSAQRRGGDYAIVGVDFPDQLSKKQNAESQMMLELALQKLQQEYPLEAQVLNLSVVHGFPSQKVAKRLKITDYEVRKHLQFCRTWLKKQLPQT